VSDRPAARTTLSHQVWSATFWNTLLLPARIPVGLVATVVFYDRLAREQVSLIFLMTSLATTIGMYADLGIERSLPPFLPEVERQSGRAGVSDLVRRVVWLKLVILLVLIGALFAAGRPVSGLLAERQRGEAARTEARALELERHGGESKDTAALRRQAEASRGLAGELESKGPLFLGAVALLLVFGALFDVDMQILTAYFKQRAWNLISLTNSLLRPVLVATFVLLGLGVAGVLLGLVLTSAAAVLLAHQQARRARAVEAAADATQPLAAGLLPRFARFASVNYLLQVTTWLYDLEIVVFLSAATLGLQQTALLAFAYKFAKDALGYLWTPLVGVMTPLLARVRGRGDPHALVEAHASLTRMVWLLLVPAGTGVCLLTPRLLQTLYPKYESGATLAVVFLGFGLAEAALAVPHNVLMVNERYRAIIFSRAVTVLSIPLVQALEPRYGLLGIALAVGLVRLAASLTTVAEGISLFRLRLPVAFGLRVAGATAAFVVVLLPLLHRMPAGGATNGLGDRVLVLLTLAGLAILGATIFLAVLRVLGGLDPSDRRRLLELKIPGRSVLARML
jgi:O-antigen/teichoic acid export membrane protein